MMELSTDKNVVNGGNYRIVVTEQAHRYLRFVRFLGSMMTAVLTIGMSQVAPDWFAVMIGVLASVGAYALFRDWMVRQLIERVEP